MTIYEPKTTKSTRAAAEQFSVCPPTSVTYVPVPCKLMRVGAGKGTAREYVASDAPCPYGGQSFDPWQKGDLLVVEVGHRSVGISGHKSSEHMSWHVGRRASTPASVRQAANLAPDGAGARCVNLHDSAVQLWRIPYRYRHAAYNLIGREFASREELELEL